MYSTLTIFFFWYILTNAKEGTLNLKFQVNQNLSTFKISCRYYLDAKTLTENEFKGDLFLQIDPLYGDGLLSK